MLSTRWSPFREVLSDMNRLQNEIIPKWKGLGLIDDVIVTQSNLNDSVQIQQMRQLVDQGVDAIIVCCSNPTALNQTVKYAYDRGVPVFSLTGYLTSPYSVNASTNYQLGGRLHDDAVELAGIGRQPALHLALRHLVGPHAGDRTDDIDVRCGGKTCLDAAVLAIRS